MSELISARQLEVLTALCDLPTAPYCEGAVVAWLLKWAAERKKFVKVKRDAVGNVFLEYVRGTRSRSPLVIEAHMDHPGFVVREVLEGGVAVCDFRGGVRPDLFEGARARFWVEGAGGPAQAGWVPAKVVTVDVDDKTKKITATLQVEDLDADVAEGTLGMWDLPDARVVGALFQARVCDDLGGVAAIVCMLEELIARKIKAHVVGLCTRAEEVGFAGVLAVCEAGGISKKSPVIGLETSKALANARQGDGAIIRIGDRSSVFSSGLSAFITSAATALAAEDKTFKFQRKLMDGGTCNSSAFCAYGWDAAAMCVALSNYHNQHVQGDAGYGEVPTAGKGIGSETVHVGDFAGMVRVLVRVAEQIGTYRPGMGALKKKLAEMYRKEQVGLLRASSSP